MLWRVAARLVTGPPAFLLAGLIDVVVFTAAFLRRRWTRAGGPDGGWGARPR